VAILVLPRVQHSGCPRKVWPLNANSVRYRENCPWFPAGCEGKEEKDLSRGRLGLEEGGEEAEEASPFDQHSRNKEKNANAYNDSTHTCFASGW